MATLPPQQVRFCHAPDGLRLAYAITGGGPPLVKAANWLTHLEHDWRALWRHWLGALSQRFALLRYDVRGSGLSDWNTTTFALESWVEDLATVVDAAGYERFPLLGVSQGAAVAVEYAVRNPERVQALVLYGGYVHGPIRRGSDEERRAAELTQQLAELGWGTDEPSFRQVFTSRFLPSGSREQWDELNELQRRTTSPANAADFLRGVAGIDISAVAPQVRCPTLVLHVRGDRMPPVREGQLLAGLIPGSRFVSPTATTTWCRSTSRRGRACSPRSTTSWPDSGWWAFPRECPQGLGRAVECAIVVSPPPPCEGAQDVHAVPRRRVTEPFLSGRYAPVHDQIDVADLSVAGTLPTDITGAYLRNGPNPKFPRLGHTPTRWKVTGCSTASRSRVAAPATPTGSCAPTA